MKGKDRLRLPQWREVRSGDMWASPDAASGPAWLQSFKGTGGEAWWWLVGGWSGPGGHGALSGAAASRGVSEGLVTKEGWPQVGWGLTAVLCAVSGGPGPPRPPA